MVDSQDQAYSFSFKALEGWIAAQAQSLSHLNSDQHAPVLALRVHHPRHALPPLKLLQDKLVLRDDSQNHGIGAYHLT